MAIWGNAIFFNNSYNILYIAHYSLMYLSGGQQNKIALEKKLRNTLVL
jgi:hypothetical protein